LAQNTSLKNGALSVPEAGKFILRADYEALRVVRIPFALDPGRHDGECFALRLGTNFAMRISVQLRAATLLVRFAEGRDESQVLSQENRSVNELRVVLDRDDLSILLSNGEWRSPKLPAGRKGVILELAPGVQIRGFSAGVLAGGRETLLMEDFKAASTRYLWSPPLIHPSRRPQLLPDGGPGLGY
jgi:hypothetical protein